MKIIDKYFKDKHLLDRQIFKKRLKNKLYIIGAIVIGVFSILLLGLTSLGSFFFSKNQVNPNTISMGCFSTSTTSSSTVSVSNANSMTDAQGLAQTPYTLTIENNCSNNVKSAYYIILKVSNNSFDSDYLRLSIDGTTAISFDDLSANLDLYNYTLDTSTYQEYFILKTGAIESDGEINFDLRVWIDEDTAIESVQNQTWSASIEVVTDPYFADVTGSGKTLAYLYSLNQKINTKNPNIGETTDDTGTSYYFKNSSNFNFVKLGNTVFRILRVNGDGTLRLALNSALSDDVAYNSSTTSPAYTGSTLETAINTWYSSTLETDYDSDLTNETFCNDISMTDDTTYSAYSRLSGNAPSPSLICSNASDKLSLKVATLTADEKELTGYQIASDYWTMTPYSNADSTYNMFTSNGNKTITSTNKVVPVINLNVTESRQLEGLGTSEEPFQLTREVPKPDIKVTLASAWPTTAGYSVNTTGCSGTWNYKTNSLEFTGGTTVPQKCTLSFTQDTSKTLLSTAVQNNATNLNNSTYSMAGYRYQGINPNNYVYFNGELWRIIGYVPACIDSACTSTPSTYRVKIIRNNSIGNYAWDYQNSSYKNYWNTSSYTSTLNTFLNSKYLTSSNGTGTTGCYGYQNYPASCDFRENGLSNVSSMIESVYWGVGTTSYSNTSSTMFASEFTSTGVTTQKVGLMSAADYGFASSGGYASTNVGSYSSSTAAGTDWLFAPYTWMILPISGSATGALIVSINGRVGYGNTHVGIGVRPAVYLNSNVYVVSGTGSGDDPYVLASGS